MNKSNFTLKVFLVVSIQSFLIGCGSSKEANTTDLASRVLPTSSSTSTASSKPIAYCSQGNGQVLNADLKVFTDSANNMRVDYVWVRLKSLPSDFSSDNSYLAFWKWFATSSGSTHFDNNVLKIALFNAKTGQPLTDWKSTLRWSDISSLASQMGATDPQGFFNNVSIAVDLKDIQGEYDVLRVSAYDVSSNQEITNTDSLLPLYHADPTDYAIDSSGAERASVLKSLHPFKDLVNQGFSSKQFEMMANDFCF